MEAENNEIENLENEEESHENHAIISSEKHVHFVDSMEEKDNDVHKINENDSDVEEPIKIKIKFSKVPSLSKYSENGNIETPWDIGRPKSIIKGCNKKMSKINSTICIG